MPRKIVKMIDGATSTEDSDPFLVDETNKTFHAVVTGTGALTATVKIDGSNDSQAVDANVKWVELAELSLSGSGEDSVGYESSAPWLQYRARLTAITGTDATVDVVMGR